jgi:hypothetical protein
MRMNAWAEIDTKPKRLNLAITGWPARLQPLLQKIGSGVEIYAWVPSLCASFGLCYRPDEMQIRPLFFFIKIFNIPMKEFLKKTIYSFFSINLYYWNFGLVFDRILD